MAIPRRGLNNIRTISGKVDQVAVPYRAYMQVTCLEMEKARRTAERQSATARVAAIDARLAAIEKEKAALLSSAERTEKNASHRSPGAVRTGPQKAAGGFKFRY